MSVTKIQAVKISQDHSSHDIDQQEQKKGKEEEGSKDNEHHDLVSVETCQECGKLDHKITYCYLRNCGCKASLFTGRSIQIVNRGAW